MSVAVSKIVESLETLAPKTLAQDWDNVGLQVGAMDHQVSKVLLALDATSGVIEEAIRLGADMIVTHHPMIFKPIKHIVMDDYLGQCIYQLIKNNISLYVMHTNFDTAWGGSNDVLGQLIGLDNIKVLSPDEDGMGIGRLGEIPPITLKDLTYKLKKTLNISHARLVGRPHQLVEKVAICTGSGMGFLTSAIGLADVFITGDVKFHEAQMAKQHNIAIIDVGHYGSENIAMPTIKTYLKDLIINDDLEVVVSQLNEDPFHII